MHSLTELVQQLSAGYVRGAASSDLFETLLPDLLAYTGSALGFIGLPTGDDASGRHVQVFTLQSIDWEASASASMIRSVEPARLVFRDVDTLFGRVLSEGQVLVSNQPPADPSGGSHTPPGYPRIENFLGLPLRHGGTLVGMLGLANRAGGYDTDLAQALQPAVDMLASIVGAIELERGQREALRAQSAAQDTLKRSEAYYQQIFETAGVGIARVATDGQLLDVNQRFADICQRTRHELLGLCVQDFTHSDDLTVHTALLEATLQGHQDRYTMEKRYLCPSGGHVWVQLNAVLARDEAGRPSHFVSVIEDISERRRYQEAILSAQAAERASKAKTEFLSRMSHELRTPLNAMLGFAQLLRVDPRHPLNDPQKQKVRHIEQAGAHLLAMLTDVLDLSRIEAGSLPLSLESLRVGEVIREAATMVGTQAQQQGVLLQQTPIDPDLHVKADPLRLRQILVNLLSNAIKYNRPEGQVRIEVQVLKPHVLIAIHDTGMGLSPEQQAHLFEPFNRLGAERSGVEGTGIGLVIVQRLAALMHGRIEVSSVQGQGSVFRVALPWAPSPVRHDDRAGVRSGFGELAALGGLEPDENLTVLYAEDNVVNVELVRQVMRMRPNWHLDVALSGAEAIEMAMASPPDLLLLDMHLGDMTGLDVADTLAQHAHTMGLPKVALSADVMPDQLRAAKERGFLDYLTKPLDVARLLKLLDSFSPQEAEAS
ncbi:MAG TPA: PAS domain S-box protein [Candidatus Aquabacterium excrementipullorum]|nr:PAS domain S-box protein [Candidatus Aquabacterium excrementipullorum]